MSEDVIEPAQVVGILIRTFGRNTNTRRRPLDRIASPGLNFERPPPPPIPFHKEEEVREVDLGTEPPIGLEHPCRLRLPQRRSRSRAVLRGRYLVP